MFRQVTFQENDIRRHSGPMRSSRMRLPAFGGRGSISPEGVSRRLDTTANQVHSRVTPTPRPPESSAAPGWMGNGNGGAGTA